MHTAAHSLSKPSLFPPLSLPSLLFFPSCTLLPALISSPFHLGRGLWARETKRTEEEERRSSNKGAWEERGDEEKRRVLSVMVHTHTYAHTHRGHCSAVLPRGPVITEAETDERVAPLFFPRSSFHLKRSPLPPCLPELLHSLINRRFPPEKKKYISGRRSRLQQHKWAHLQQVWLQGESKGLTLTLLGPPLDFPDSMPAWMSSDNGSSKLSCCGCMYCICCVQVQAQRFFRKRVQTNWAVSLDTLPGTLAKQEYRETISTNAIQLSNSSCFNDIGFLIILSPMKPNVQKYWVDDRFHSATNCNLDDSDSGQEWWNVLRHVRTYALFNTCEPTVIILQTTDIQIQNWLYNIGSCKMRCFTVLLVRTLTLRFLRMYWYSKQDAAGSHVAVVSIGVRREYFVQICIWTRTDLSKLKCWESWVDIWYQPDMHIHPEHPVPCSDVHKF